MNKKILLSSVVASMLLFSGCGSDDSDTTNDSISGVVADGYIKGAKVFLDMNCNGLQVEKLL
jgi:outer membrane murein-binding lipoprotein Lpp